MKITKTQLRQIIKEELSQVLGEKVGDVLPPEEFDSKRYSYLSSESEEGTDVPFHEKGTRWHESEFEHQLLQPPATGQGLKRGTLTVAQPWETGEEDEEHAAKSFETDQYTTQTRMGTTPYVGRMGKKGIEWETVTYKDTPENQAAGRVGKAIDVISVGNKVYQKGSKGYEKGLAILMQQMETTEADVQAKAGLHSGKYLPDTGVDLAAGED